MTCRVPEGLQGTVRDVLSLQVQVKNTGLQWTPTNRGEYTAKGQGCKDGGKQGTRERNESRHPAWTYPPPWLRDRLWGTRQGWLR